MHHVLPIHSVYSFIRTFVVKTSPIYFMVQIKYYKFKSSLCEMKRILLLKSFNIILCNWIPFYFIFYFMRKWEIKVAADTADCVLWNSSSITPWVLCITEHLHVWHNWKNSPLSFASKIKFWPARRNLWLKFQIKWENPKQILDPSLLTRYLFRYRHIYNSWWTYLLWEKVSVHS